MAHLLRASCMRSASSRCQGVLSLPCRVAAGVALPLPQLLASAPQQRCAQTTSILAELDKITKQRKYLDSVDKEGNYAEEGALTQVNILRERLRLAKLEKTIIPEHIREFKANNDIPEHYTNFKLIGGEKEYLGEVSRVEAFRIARQRNEDLILVNAKVKPFPVCKIGNFRQFIRKQIEVYEEQEKRATDKEKAEKPKEIRVKLKTCKRDFEMKLEKSWKWFDQGKRVLFTVCDADQAAAKQHLTKLVESVVQLDSSLTYLPHFTLAHEMVSTTVKRKPGAKSRRAVPGQEVGAAKKKQTAAEEKDAAAPSTEEEDSTTSSDEDEDTAEGDAGSGAGAGAGASAGAETAADAEAEEADDEEEQTKLSKEEKEARRASRKAEKEAKKAAKKAERAAKMVEQDDEQEDEHKRE